MNNFSSILLDYQWFNMGMLANSRYNAKEEKLFIEF